MSTNSNPNEPNWPPFAPKSEAEKEEAFKLLDELQRGIAREDAFRELVGRALPPTDQVPSSPRKPVEPEKKYSVEEIRQRLAESMMLEMILREEEEEERRSTKEGQ
ncbi:MAG: hypothetical protein NTV93_20545 [Verrucomicrobia bacterium]|nr:hypothetical protein [Verrucomicrobiota bacterium]